MTLQPPLGAGALLLCASLIDWCQPPPPPPPKPTVVEPTPAPETPPAPPANTACPSPKIRDILRTDKKVQEAMKEAWEASQEGTPQEHEESFWVVQRRNINVTPVTYDTVIVKDKPGTVDSGGGSIEPRVSGGRVVMHFHTHPGPHSETSGEGYYNEDPSPADIKFQEAFGVPMAVRYGPTPEGTGTFIFNQEDGTPLEKSRNLQWDCPDAPPDDPPPPGGPPTCSDCARSTGDPHLATHDGRTYDLQAAGEFVAVAVDGEPRVQLRMQPADAAKLVTLTTAAALRVGQVRVTIRPGAGLWVDGVAVPLAPSSVGIARQTMLVMVGDTPVGREPPRLALTGGGAVTRHGQDYVVDWPDGSRAWVQLLDRSLDVFFAAPDPLRGQTTGLFGSHDGDPGNDFTTREGEALGEPDHATLHGRFADAWRVRADESLFDYGPGESTETFTDRSVPAAPATLESLTPEARGAAAKVCVDAGISDPVALAECTLDVALGHDLDFVRSAQAVQTLGDPRPGLHPTRHHSSTVATGGPRYRIEYKIHQYGQDMAITVAVDPPREALHHEMTRAMFDGRRTVTCVDAGGAVQCYEREEHTKLDPFNGVGLTESPETLRAWLSRPADGHERYEARTLAGRKAACRISGEASYTATVCHDLELGVLLLSSITAGDQRVVDVQAASVGRPREADFKPPPGVVVQPLSP